MAFELALAPDDTPERRKARGAFFTPQSITRYIANWAIRSPDDRVLEPSAGDAAFMIEAVSRLRDLGNVSPAVEGVEIHEHSARVARERVREAGGRGNVAVSDFFLIEPSPRFDAVIGNPPFVRYQEWTGVARERSRAAVLKAGVPLSGLASSWAAFTVQAAMFLAKGGRLGLVLPAELLSVNYAGPVRKFLFANFDSIELVLFEKQIFDEAEADTLLLLADGFGRGSTDHAKIRQVTDASSLPTDADPVAWAPADPSHKWVGSLADVDGAFSLQTLFDEDRVTSLQTWGETTLGIVTGSNQYFALSPDRVRELGLAAQDVVSLSPPGSAHLRELSLTNKALSKLGERGRATWLFRPTAEPSVAALEYIRAGEAAGVHEAYKCRVRSVWWRVPLLAPADLLLTYMNGDAVRLVTNTARVHHLNSVHGVYLKPELRGPAMALLPLASLNSATMLSAEMTGRSYGGGILKMEPREADQWLMPTPEVLAHHGDELRRIRPRVLDRLQRGNLAAATELIDNVLFRDILSHAEMAGIRAAHAALQARRMTRSRRG